LIFAVGFIVASLFANIWSSQWLAKAGPFAVSETVMATLKQQVRLKRAEAKEGAQKTAALEERLVRSNEMIDQLAQVIEKHREDQHKAQEEVAALKAKLGNSD
jgi:hypothetical protein